MAPRKQTQATEQLGLWGSAWDEPEDASPARSQASRVTLRWYQQDAVEAVLSELTKADATMVVAATGCGKTEIFTEIIRRWPGPVLVLAHREELVHQAAERIERNIGETVGIEAAELYSPPNVRVVVGSFDSVRQPKRLQRLGKDRFTLLIVDESHHILAKTYLKTVKFFEGAKLLGVTATPDRGDKKALGRIFTSVAYNFGIWEAIESGYLVPIVGKRVHLDEINLEGVETRCGDLVASQLDVKIVEAVEGIVQETIRLGGERQGVCFFPGVRSAELAAERFNAVSAGSAGFVCGETPKDERRRIFKDFRNGSIKYLCNCLVATEGFDAPSASMVVQARPTKSRALCCQMVGRGTRVLPGTTEPYPYRDDSARRRAAIACSGKRNVLVLDFVGTSTDLSLMTPVDILGGDYTEEEVSLAKKIADDPAAPTEPQELLVRARSELKAIAASMRGSVRSRVESFDPFALAGCKESDSSKYSKFATPATEPMLQSLARAGFPDHELRGLTKKAAGKMLTELKRRRDEGLATVRQMKMLSGYGVTDPNLTFAKASDAITYIIAQKGRRTLGTSELSKLLAIVA